MGLLDELKKYVKDALPGGLLNPEVTSQGILDGAALSTTAMPVVGDLLGLGADLNRYKNEPESRTLGNFALSGLGMLPFVPNMGGVLKGPDVLKMFPEFSGTKAATSTGEPLMLHHGTIRQEPIQEFNRRFKPDVMKGKDSIDSIGTWFTNNPQRVTDYGTADYPSFANLQNPKVFNSFDELRDAWREVQTEGKRNKAYRERVGLFNQNPHWGSSDEFVSEMRFDGHDGVIIKKHGNGEWRDQDAYVVFDPLNIKSAISP